MHSLLPFISETFDRPLAQYVVVSVLLGTVRTGQHKKKKNVDGEDDAWDLGKRPAMLR